jgi:hypothetical protein
LIWLFAIWFFFTEKQKRHIEHTYCAGIRIVYNLWGWDDYVTLVLARDKTMLDYVFNYWRKFMGHLSTSPEGHEYRETWEAYLISKTTDKTLYKSMGLRKNNFFMSRFTKRAHHTNCEVFAFFCIHERQRDFFKKSTEEVVRFRQKYIDPP